MASSIVFNGSLLTKSSNHGISFRTFLAGELQQIYLLELNIRGLLSKIIGSISNQPLKRALGNYINCAGKHMSILRKMGVKTSEIAVNRKQEAKIMIMPFSASIDKHFYNDKMKEITLITGLQRMLFYQMAAYRSLCTGARKIDNFEWADCFDCILKEKKVNDSIFSEIALTSIYSDAIREA